MNQTIEMTLHKESVNFSVREGILVILLKNFNIQLKEVTKLKWLALICSQLHLPSKHRSVKCLNILLLG